MNELLLNIEVRIPEEYLGQVLADISSRQGLIVGIDCVDGIQIVKARIPQKELQFYSSALRSLTNGRGTHTQEGGAPALVAPSVNQTRAPASQPENKTRKVTFTAASDGHDWLRADEHTKRQLCVILASALSLKHHRTVKADFLYGCIDEFYSEEDASIRNTKVFDLAEIAVVAEQKGL